MSLLNRQIAERERGPLRFPTGAVVTTAALLLACWGAYKWMARAGVDRHRTPATATAPSTTLAPSKFLRYPATAAPSPAAATTTFTSDPPGLGRRSPTRGPHPR
jgi:hypothetical protein